MSSWRSKHFTDRAISQAKGLLSLLGEKLTKTSKSCCGTTLVGGLPPQSYSVALIPGSFSTYPLDSLGFIWALDLSWSIWLSLWVCSRSVSLLCVIFSCCSPQQTFSPLQTNLTQDYMSGETFPRLILTSCSILSPASSQEQSQPENTQEF